MEVKQTLTQYMATLLGNEIWQAQMQLKTISKRLALHPIIWIM